MLKSVKSSDFVKGYLRKLSQDDRMYVYHRLKDRCGGDLGDAMAVLQQHSDMNYWLASARSSDDLYDMLDVVEKTIQESFEK